MWSISSSIKSSDSELIYHTSAGVIVITHGEVEHWDVDYSAIVAEESVSHSELNMATDVNKIPDVRIKSCYVQTKWSNPSEVDNSNQRLTCEVADSMKQACRIDKYQRVGRLSMYDCREHAQYM